MLSIFLEILKRRQTKYCVIGGLAVNAYVEPVVSLDLDIVIAAEDLDAITDVCKERFAVKTFPHSVNLECENSDLRIQLQKDARYQSFIERAEWKSVLGYEMRVAAVEDVLAGKTWAFLDGARRGSKRQKDLADIMRLTESYPALLDSLPEEIRRLCK